MVRKHWIGLVFSVALLALVAGGCGTKVAVQAPNTWTELGSVGPAPSPRAGHAMVYDSDTGKAILFGGFSGSVTGGAGSTSLDSVQAYNDTWTYDPVAGTWTELEPSGPTPSGRAFHAMVYDPLSKRAILFGGVDASTEEGALLNDTWSFDPSANTWTEIKPSGAIPPARIEHAMVCDPASGKVILFGGRWEDTTPPTGDTLNDTWSFDPSANTWTEIKPSGPLPPARARHAMVFDSGTGKVILFGGASSSISVSSETFTVNGVESGPTDVINLSPPQPFGDTWAYDPVANAWSELKPGAVPSPRADHAMICDAKTGMVVLFGGSPLKGGSWLNDMWSYDPALNAWAELKSSDPKPPARKGFAMVYDPQAERVVLFGGLRVDPSTGEFSFCGDIWTYTPALGH